MDLTHKIRTNKTPQGYSIHVWVKDGQLVKPLVQGLEKFFLVAEQQNDSIRQLDEYNRERGIVE